MFGALDGYLAGLSGGPKYQTLGAIVKGARRWFWQTRFYRENDAERYVRMGNGELRRKDMERWREQRRKWGLPDTRAAYKAHRRAQRVSLRKLKWNLEGGKAGKSKN